MLERCQVVHFLSPQHRDGARFFRHRGTGFETIDAGRLPTYRAADALAIDTASATLERIRSFVAAAAARMPTHQSFIAQHCTAAQARVASESVGASGGRHTAKFFS